MTRRFFDDTTVETASRSNYANLDDDSLATLDNIVIMTIKQRDSLITRQGASFDVDGETTASASLGNIIVTSNVLQTGQIVVLLLVVTRMAMLNTHTHITTSGGTSLVM